MTDPLTMVTILLVTIPAVLIFFAVWKLTKNNTNLFTPLLSAWGGMITIGFLLSLSIALNLAHEHIAGLAVTVIGILAILILLYTVFVPAASVLGKALLFVFVLIVVLALIIENTEPYFIWVAIGLVLLFAIIYALSFKKRVDRIYFNKLVGHKYSGWIIYFLLAAAFISEILLFTKFNDISTSGKVLAILIFILLFTFIATSYIPKVRQMFS